MKQKIEKIVGAIYVLAACAILALSWSLYRESNHIASDRDMREFVELLHENSDALREVSRNLDVSIRQLQPAYLKNCENLIGVTDSSLALANEMQKLTAWSVKLWGDNKFAPFSKMTPFVSNIRNNLENVKYSVLKTQDALNSMDASGEKIVIVLNNTADSYEIIAKQVEEVRARKDISAKLGLGIMLTLSVCLLASGIHKLCP